MNILSPTGLGGNPGDDASTSSDGAGAQPCPSQQPSPRAISVTDAALGASAALDRFWQARAVDLAYWAYQRLLNRADVWGAYLPLEARTADQPARTAPRVDLRGREFLTPDLLVRHFRGQEPYHLIGLHALALQNTARWFVVDVDQHGDDGGSVAAANFAAGLDWLQVLRSLGFHPLLLDSNGAGGLHILQIFAEPVASSVIHSFVNWLIRDFADRKLLCAPEAFPKQPVLTPTCPYGNFWRLPGRHHTRPHWTRVRSGTQWLAGDAAIDALLATTGDSASLIPVQQIGAAPLTPASSVQRVSGTSETPRANDWVDLLVGLHEGERHNSLVRLTGHWLGHGLEPLEVEQLALLWNLRNQPPLDDDEVQRTVADIAQRNVSQLGLGRSARPGRYIMEI